MTRSSRVRLVILILSMAATGCTATQLRRHTINQNATIHDIYQQQILDNLAMFVHNRNSYPYFVLVGQGTSTLTDSATLADTNGWALNSANRLLFATAGLNPSATRMQQGAWQTYPINDSVKLNVMQCVYRMSVDGGLGPIDDSCQDCGNLFYAYYNMRPPSSIDSIPYHNGPSNDPSDPSNKTLLTLKLSKLIPAGIAFDTVLQYGAQDQFKGYLLSINSGPELHVVSSVSNKDAQNPKTTLILEKSLDKDIPAGTEYTLSKQLRPPIRGIVTPECLHFRPSWFCSGPKLPKHLDKCTPWGYYCGTYVWISEGCIDQLTKLTLLIQDVAYYDPPQAGTQTVTTQKSKDAPGPKVALKAALVGIKANLEKNREAWNDTDRIFHNEINNSINSLDEDTSTTTTTTTTVTPASRRPTQFQPGVFNLQQDLNLLPRQPR